MREKEFRADQKYTLFWGTELSHFLFCKTVIIFVFLAAVNPEEKTTHPGPRLCYHCLYWFARGETKFLSTKAFC